MYKHFTSHYETNNKIIGSIKIKKIIEQIKPEIPMEIQRIEDVDKVNEIIKYQDIFFKKKHHFNFLGLINIHYCKEDGKYLLIDGQHRYKAMRKLYKDHNYEDFNVDIELILVDNWVDMEQNYKTLNNNTELPEFPKDIDKKVPETVAQFFFAEYPKIWTKKKRNIRPLLNKNNFQEAIGYLLSKINKNNIDNGKEECDVEGLKKLILEKNEKMSNWQVDAYIANIRRIKKWPEYLKECREHSLFLGMYSHTNEEYCYDWVKDIVVECTGEKLKKERKICNKKKIPKNLKNEIWNFYNGKKQTDAKCYCCDIKVLHITSWDCGHVVAEINGGELTIKNLRPICSNCNKTMGTENLYDFMKKNYLSRYKTIEGGNFIKHPISGLDKSPMQKKVEKKEKNKVEKKEKKKKKSIFSNIW